MDIDGHAGMAVMPFPHNPYDTGDAARYDKLTVKDRLDEIAHELSPLERTGLEAYLMVLSGSKPETSGFFDVLRVWALGNYSFKGLIQVLSTFKLRSGQSSFARHFFQEALDTGNLSYVFDCPVSVVCDRGGEVRVTAVHSGAVFRGRQVVCTIPHNVLGSISFSPPLSREKSEALRAGQVNRVSKVHAEVRGGSLRSWTAMAYPHNEILQAFGDGTTRANNTHIVCFGADVKPLPLEQDIQATRAAVQAMHPPMEIRRLLFHNWSRDDFSRGGWSWLDAGVATKHMAALRASHGNVIFASGDWALGWRAAIDGAIEEGMRAALAAKTTLALLAKKSHGKPRL